MYIPSRKTDSSSQSVPSVTTKATCTCNTDVTPPVMMNILIST